MAKIDDEDSITMAQFFFVFPPRLGGCTEICLDECVPLGLPDALFEADFAFLAPTPSDLNKRSLAQTQRHLCLSSHGTNHFILSPKCFHRP